MFTLLHVFSVQSIQKVIKHCSIKSVSLVYTLFIFIQSLTHVSLYNNHQLVLKVGCILNFTSLVELPELNGNAEFVVMKKFGFLSPSHTQTVPYCTLYYLHAAIGSETSCEDI